VEDRLIGVAVLGAPGSGCGEIGSLLESSGFFRVRGAAFRRFDPGHFTTARTWTNSLEDWTEAASASVGETSNQLPGRDVEAESGVDEANGLSLLISDARDRSGGAPLVIDDVRVIPLWMRCQEVFREGILPLVVLRNPMAVARTIADRHHLTVSESLSLWEIYMATICELCANLPVVVIGADAALSSRSDAQTLLKLISSHLEQGTSNAISEDLLPLEMAIPEYFRSASAEEFGRSATQHQVELWDRLSSVGEGFVSFPNMEAEFRQPSLLAAENEAQRARRQSLPDEVQRLEQELAQVKSDLYVAQRSHDDVSSRLMLQSAETQQARQLASELLTRIRTMAQAQGEAHRHIGELEDEVRHLRADLKRAEFLHQKELTELRSSETWRVGRAVVRPLRWTFSMGRRRSRRLHGG
jgi:hypothetical protein